MNTLEKKVDALIRLQLCEDSSERVEILKSLRELVGEKEPTPNTNKNKRVEDILFELGTPDSLCGHRYLVYAIKLVVKEPNIKGCIVSKLYPEVGKKFNTTGSRVERGIRHAIEVTWDRADFEVIAKYFGSTVHPNKGKPTNAEFIARIANVLRLQNEDLY